MDRGYIKVWRKIEDWEWVKDPQTLGFFIYLMLKANYKDSRYMGYDIPRGALVCGRKSLSEELGLGEQTIRTLITRLKSTNEITIKVTSRFSIVYIANYNKYQDKPTSTLTNNLTTDQPAPNQHLTTSKEVKKERSNTPPTLDSVKDFFKDDIMSAEFFNHYEANGWVQGNKGKPIKSWEAAARGWKSRQRVFNKTDTGWVKQ